MFASIRQNEKAMSSGLEAAVGLFLLATSMVILFVVFVVYKP